MKLTNRLPSPAMTVAIVALIFAVAGTSLAGVSAFSKKEKKQARSIADQQIDTRAPGLTVLNATNATNANTAANATNATNAANATNAVNATNAANANTATTATNLVAPEAYHVVGQPGEPAFENGFTNLGGGYATAAFLRDKQGFVHLRGTLGAGTPGTTAFTLPPGHRPSATVRGAAVGDNNLAAAIEVFTNGQVHPLSNLGTGTFGLDGFSFRTG